MATFSSRFPSKQAIFQVFAICAVSVHLWAFIAIFRAVPSWILSMSIWEMAGVAAYPFTFALFESLLILLGLLIAAVILPEKIYRKWFVSQSALIVFFATIWASLIQIYGQEWGVWSTRGAITLLPLALVIGISAFLNAHYMKLQKALESVADRLLILGILYVVIDLVFLVIVIVRNI